MSDEERRDEDPPEGGQDAPEAAGDDAPAGDGGGAQDGGEAEDGDATPSGDDGAAADDGDESDGGDGDQAAPSGDGDDDGADAGQAGAMLANAQAAEALLVPEHLERPDDVHLLSDEEREEAFELARAGKAPAQDLKALVAERRAARGEPAPGPEAEPLAAGAAKTLGGDPPADDPPAEDPAADDPAPPPAPRKTLGGGDDPASEDRGERPATGSASGDSGSAAPAPAAQAAPPPEPPPPPPSLGTRVVGLVYLALAALCVYLFTVPAFGSELATDNERIRWVIRLAALLPLYPGLLGAWSLIQGRRPPDQLNPVGLPLDAWWYVTLGTMTRREVTGLLARPVAYVALFFFLLANGFLFVLLLVFYGSPDQGQDFQVPVTFYLTSNPILWVVLMLICPALTMRMLAEEARSGTLEMLLTAPVTDVQVVVSKYLGALTCYAAMLLSMVAYLAILRGYASSWDWGPILGGYLGMFLVGALFLAIGLFASSITRTQFVSFLIALVPILALFFINLGEYAVESPEGRAVLRHFNVRALHDDMARGLVYSRTVLLHLSGVVLFLFLAVRGVESHLVEVAVSEPSGHPDVPGSNVPQHEDTVSFVLAILSALTGLMLVAAYFLVKWAEDAAGPTGSLPFEQKKYALAVGVGLIILGVGLQFDRLVDLVRSRRTVHAVNAVLLSALAVCLFGLVNYVSARHNVPADLTSEGLYSLGEDSRAVARTLGQEVKVVALLPPSGQMDVNRVDVLLEQYRAEAPDDIHIEYIDPYKLSPEEQRETLEELELTGRTPQEVLGLVVQAGEETEEGWQVSRSRHIPLTELYEDEVDQRNQQTKRVFKGEQAVTSALLEVTEERKAKVYFTSGHAEASAVDFDPRYGLSNLAQNLRQKNLEVEPLDLSLSPEIPEDADVLVVAGPRRTLSPRAVEAIEDYLQRGGDMIALLEPVADHAVDPPRYVQTGLERVLQEEYGIGLEDRQVVWGEVPREQGGNVQALPASQHPIVKPFSSGLKAFLAYHPRPLTVIEGFALAEAQPLLTTHPEAPAEVFFSTVNPRREQITDRLPGPFVIAAASERRLMSPDTPQEAPGAVAEAVAEAPLSRVVVIGDLELAQNLLTSDPRLGNLELVYNAVQWAREQEDRAVGQVHRPTSYKLNFQGAELAFFMLIALAMPFVAVGLGVLVWLVRR